MDRDSGVSLRGGEETEVDQAGGSKPRRFWQFWLSLPGFITAIASLLGALAALAALFVHQNQQLTQRTEALEQAVQEFRKVLANYPRSDKAPASLYKEALVLIELKQTDAAQQRLQYLVETFPQSEESALARERLAALRPR